MQTITDINVFDRLLVVNLDIHILSARKKLLPQDFGNASLRTEDIVSLGSKRVCNPDDLKTFATLKARATSLLERTGIRFLNGCTIFSEKWEEIDIALAAIRDEFNTAFSPLRNAICTYRAINLFSSLAISFETQQKGHVYPEKVYLDEKVHSK